MGKRFKLPDGATLFEQVHALALANRGPRRQTRAHVEKVKATKAAKLKARQAAATEAWHAKRKAKKSPIGDRWVDRCVKVMEPGQWYADRDLQILTGCKEDQPVQVDAMKAKLIERRRNPEWRGQNRYGEMQQPKWLYRLTATGEAHRAMLDLLD